MELAQLKQGLFDDYQHHFPFSEHPFDDMAQRFGVVEADLIDHIKELIKKGVIARVGPVFYGKSSRLSRLVLMSVPHEQLEKVASVICSFDEVVHCYEREHNYNLWFVVSKHSEKALDWVLSLIKGKTKYKPIVLPVLHDYRIDEGIRLNFDSTFEKTTANVIALKTARTQSTNQVMTETEQKITRLIHRGLPICETPYKDLGKCLGITGSEVTGVIQLMYHRNLLRRWGVVFRYCEMGYHSSATVVWDIPNKQLDSIATKIAGKNTVSVCVKRPRCLPDWRYNLFSEIHGKTALAVVEEIETIVNMFGLQGFERSVLFSGRCFKHPRGSVDW